MKKTPLISCVTQGGEGGERGEGEKGEEGRLIGAVLNLGFVFIFVLFCFVFVFLGLESQFLFFHHKNRSYRTFFTKKAENIVNNPTKTLERYTSALLSLCFMEDWFVILLIMVIAFPLFIFLLLGKQKKLKKFSRFPEKSHFFNTRMT